MTFTPAFSKRGSRSSCWYEITCSAALAHRQRCTIALWCKWMPANRPSSPRDRCPSKRVFHRRAARLRRSPTGDLSFASPASAVMQTKQLPLLPGEGRGEGASSSSRHSHPVLSQKERESKATLFGRTAKFVVSRPVFGYCFFRRELIAPACPFCSAVRPTIAQQREHATVAFLGECKAVDSLANPANATFAVRKWFKGRLTQDAETVRIHLTDSIQSVRLHSCWAMATTPKCSDKLEWKAIPLTEVGFAYVAGLPDLRQPAAERLAYFAKFLEHSDPLLAEDAFLEFGYVPYDLAAPAIKKLRAVQLRSWMDDAHVPTDRKGFYGLALGLTAQSRAGSERCAAKKVGRY